MSHRDNGCIQILLPNRSACPLGRIGTHLRHASGASDKRRPSADTAVASLIMAFCFGQNDDVARDQLENLRRLCLALPETTERLSHGEPTWFVRGKKTFVTYADHHHDDRLAFWCAAPGGVQEAMVTSDPDRYFVPPYVGHRGWLGVYLDVPVNWEEIADLVEDAYRVVAPKRLLETLESPTRRQVPGPG